MFRTVFFQTSKRISETLIGVALFILTESWFIVSVRQLGVIATIAIFSVFYSLAGLLLFSWFQREEQSPSAIGRITRWIIQRAKTLEIKYARLVATSNFVATITASVFAGALVTTIFIGLLGYRGRRAAIYIILQSTFSVSVWALFYAGGLRLIFGR